MLDLLISLIWISALGVFISHLFINHYLDFGQLYQKKTFALAFFLGTTNWAFISITGLIISLFAYYDLAPLKINFLILFLFPLGIFTLVQFTEIVANKINPNFYRRFHPLAKIIAINSSFLGVGLELFRPFSLSLFGNIFSYFVTGFGFFMLLIVFACLKNRLQPKTNRSKLQAGLIDLTTMALFSLALTGAIGMVN